MCQWISSDIGIVQPGIHQRIVGVSHLQISCDTYWYEKYPYGYPTGGNVAENAVISSCAIFSALLHLGFGVAKCTLIKNCVVPTKPASNLRRAAGRTHFSFMGYPNFRMLFNGHGVINSYLSLCVYSERITTPVADEVARIPNLQVVVSSRLVDPVHKYAQGIPVSMTNLNSDSEREKMWVFSKADITASWNRLWISILKDKDLRDKFPAKFTVTLAGFAGIVFPWAIADTPIQQTAAARQKCRICNKHVRDTDRQMHVGGHILTSVFGVPETGTCLFLIQE
ncbi:hypothetical protein B0H11DRAFT_1936312 [Mycena galericulata]|nr:hypothetical protein B0H11DRAFT_1936312 [Mycena galericulata]